MSYGACCGTPAVASPTRSRTLRNERRCSSARRASSGTRSMVMTVPFGFTAWARRAACQPEPVPISNTVSPAFGCTNSSMLATVVGCDTVCPCPMDSGASTVTAATACSGGTKRERGIARNASMRCGVRRVSLATKVSTSARQERSRFCSIPAFAVYPETKVCLKNLSDGFSDDVCGRDLVNNS